MAKKAPTPPRTKAEIQQDFTNVCARIGDLEFTKRLATMELEQLYPEAFNLRQEMQAAKE